MRKWFVVIPLLICGLLMVTVWRWWPTPPSVAAASTEVLPTRTEGGFATSRKCVSCHAEQHASWHDSYHRTMTQWATPTSVQASFDDVQLSTAGQSATLYRRDDQFWVNVVDPDWEREQFATWQPGEVDGELSRAGPVSQAPPRIDAQIVMTTGSHHFQVYWFRGPRGRELYQFPWRYHLAEARWIHRKDVFLAPPQWQPGMWFRMWNHQCSLCHSTGPVPGENLDTGVMEGTAVAELGIACESCHGPGEAHVALHTAGPVAADQEDPIVNPARLSHRRAAEVCGACHAHFEHRDPLLTVHGPRFRPGRNLNHFGALMDPPPEPAVLTRFWKDGTNRSGGREFSGMSTSACYLEGELSCLQCHSMHGSDDPDDQLTSAARSNEVCLACHTDFREKLTEHTHHAADSSGSQCYNCHMPHTNYALFKAIRSHHIGSPAVKPIAANAKPNACNLCHLDRTLAWTAGMLSEWYGHPEVELHTDEQQVSAAVLWALRGDAGQRVIAAWHFGWSSARDASSEGFLVPLLAELLQDPYAAVRWVAYESLRTYDSFRELKYVFDEEAAHWAVVSQEVLQRWSAWPPPMRLPADLGQVLLRAVGEVDQARWKPIRDARDNRPVAGVE